MPIYEQQCNACGKEFEIIVLRASDDSPRPCKHCGSFDTDQLVSLTHGVVRGGPARLDIKNGPCHNPFQDLTLQHIRGDDGKPIKVNSARELAAAEKKYGFVHAASNGLEDKPPQHDEWSGDISHTYRRKWNHDPVAYKNTDGVSAGVLNSAEESLHSVKTDPNKEIRGRI